jgi:hypothetical protein
MMDNLATIMKRWEEVLNGDTELAERNKSIYSSVEGRIPLQIEIEGLSPYKVGIKGGKFTIQKGSDRKPLLAWKLPVVLFKEVMLGKQRLIYAMLDSRGTLSFDTPNFSHWNGATIIEMLFLACEMGQKESNISKLVEGLEGH